MHKTRKNEPVAPNSSFSGLYIGRRMDGGSGEGFMCRRLVTLSFAVKTSGKKGQFAGAGQIYLFPRGGKGAKKTVIWLNFPSLEEFRLLVMASAFFLFIFYFRLQLCTESGMRGAYKRMLFFRTKRRQFQAFNLPSPPGKKTLLSLTLHFVHVPRSLEEKNSGFHFNILAFSSARSALELEF